MILSQTPKAKAIAEKKMSGAIVNPHARVPINVPMAVLQPEKPTLIRLAPLHVRAVSWVVWLMFPIAHPVLALLAWVQFPLKVYEFARVVFGGRVKEGEYHDREQECKACKDCHRVAAERNGTIRTVADYCGMCGCGKWLMARLSVKNRYRNWECPRGKHELTDYRLDRWIQYAEQHGYEAQAAEWKYEQSGRPKRKGCGG